MLICGTEMVFMVNFNALIKMTSSANLVGKILS